MLLTAILASPSQVRLNSTTGLYSTTKGQGFFYMLGKFAADSPLIGGTMINEMAIVGGLLIISSGLSLLKLKDCKTLNYIPALAVPALWFLVKGLFS